MAGSSKPELKHTTEKSVVARYFLNSGQLLITIIQSLTDPLLTQIPAELLKFLSVTDQDNDIT